MWMCMHIQYISPCMCACVCVCVWMNTTCVCWSVKVCKCQPVKADASVRAGVLWWAGVTFNFSFYTRNSIHLCLTPRHIHIHKSRDTGTCTHIRFLYKFLHMVFYYWIELLDYLSLFHIYRLGLCCQSKETYTCFYSFTCIIAAHSCI